MKGCIAYVVVVQAVLFCFAALAQPCSQEELQKKPATWKEGIKGSTNNVRAANLAKEKEVVQSIFSMIKEGYSPVDCELTHTWVYGYNDCTNKIQVK